MDFLNAIQVVNAQSSVPYLACSQYYSQEVLKCICTIAISESKTGNLTCFFLFFLPPPPPTLRLCLVTYGMISTLAFIKGGVKSQCQAAVYRCFFVSA